VVDHGSTDGSLEMVRDFAACHPKVELVPLTRTAADRKSPSRPLNEGIAVALRKALGPTCREWLFRLDADDVLVTDEVGADLIREGGYRALIMATVIFFDQRTRSAYEYGPRRGYRTLRRLPGRDVYAVAHHATAMRLDLLSTAARAAPLYDEGLETGEDLGATCRLLRELRGDESRFAFVAMPYCYKKLDAATITGSLPLRRVWASHRKLLRDHRELAAFAVIRGLAELALSRLVGETLARRSLQHLAGRNGEYRAVDFGRVARRLKELALPQ
jgi:glycosyltransferase involved in cell wall biosynthesis